MPILEAVYCAVRVRNPEPISEWDADECCYVCQRNFGEKYDPEDADEIACSPLRRPCGHLVGSECWKQFLDQDFDSSECPYQCLAHYDGPDTVPFWIKFLCNYVEWDGIEDFTHSIVVRVPWADKRLSRLHMKAYLDLRPLSAWDRWELWAYYYVGALLFLARSGLFALALLSVPCGVIGAIVFAVTSPLCTLRLCLDDMCISAACGAYITAIFVSGLGFLLKGIQG